MPRYEIAQNCTDAYATAFQSTEAGGADGPAAREVRLEAAAGGQGVTWEVTTSKGIQEVALIAGLAPAIFREVTRGGDGGITMVRRKNTTAGQVGKSNFNITHP